MQENILSKDEKVAVLTTNPKALYNNFTMLKNENVLEALESYDKYKYNGSNPTTAYIKARIKNLYRHINQDLKRNLKEKDYLEVKELISSDDYKKMLEAYETHISNFMAEIGLISTAKTRDYDVQNAIDEDDAKGL